MNKQLSQVLSSNFPQKSDKEIEDVLGRLETLHVKSLRDSLDVPNEAWNEAHVPTAVRRIIEENAKDEEGSSRELKETVKTVKNVAEDVNRLALEIKKKGYVQSIPSKTMAEDCRRMREDPPEWVTRVYLGPLLIRRHQFTINGWGEGDEIDGRNHVCKIELPTHFLSANGVSGTPTPEEKILFRKWLTAEVIGSAEQVPPDVVQKMEPVAVRNNYDTSKSLNLRINHIWALRGQHSNFTPYAYPTFVSDYYSQYAKSDKNYIYLFFRYNRELS